MVRTLPHGTTHFLSIFLLPASIIAKGINLSSLNAFQSLKTIKTGITSSKSSKKLCHTTNPPTALPVGVSRVRPPKSGITPLTCTIFDPVLQPPFHPHFRSLICLRTPGFLLISPNRLTQGRILPSRSLYPVLQNNVTRCHTQAHTAVSVPFPFHCPVTVLKSEDGHMWLQFRDPAL